MIKKFSMFITLILITTAPPLLSYSPSALFTVAHQQKNHVTLSFSAVPSDDPLAQIRSARRNNGNYHKKNNHKAYFSSLEYALTQQRHTPYYQKRCKVLDKTRNNNKRIKRTTMVNHDVALFAQKKDATK